MDNKENNFIEEYNSMIKDRTIDTVISPVEWTEPGDIIKKFTLYEKYTPVKTSGNTTLIS